MNRQPLRNDGGGGSSGRARLLKPAFAGMLMLGMFLLWVAVFSPQPHVESPVPRAAAPVRERLPDQRSPAPAAAVPKPQMAPVSAGRLTPRPMQLTRRVLLEKKWDSAPDALGRTLPPNGEGTMVGPTAVACVGGAIYVLDRSNERVAVYDTAGRMTAAVAVPGKSFGDLVVAPSDSSVLVVDQVQEAVYKLSGTGAIEVASVPLKEFSLGAMFGYDEPSGTLYVHSDELDGDIPLLVQGLPVDPKQRVVQTLAPVRGDFDGARPDNLLLKFKDGRELRVGFERPVQCVEEMAMDQQGIVWVLYTLQGDYRIRRLARVDPVRQTVGVAVLDVFFVYDVARHMAPSGNGVVLVAGDRETGRLLAFEYSGSL